jgi:ribosome biogenesis GTPase A
MPHGKKAKMRKMERRAAPKEMARLRLITPADEEDKSHREKARARVEKPDATKFTAIDGMLMGILGFNPNKMANGKSFKKMESIFAKEARFEVDARVVLARNVLGPRDPSPVAWLVQHLEHPIRPAWDKTMTREELDERETQSFNGWLARIYSTHEPRDLCYFEHNLEVWRQLWRVMEKSQVLVIVTDARNPLVHIPLPLVRQASQMGKRVVILLNKVDLLTREQIKAWMIFIMSYIPGCKVVPFSAHPDRVKGRKVQGRKNQELPDPATDPAVLALMKVCGVKLREDLGIKEVLTEEEIEQRKLKEEERDEKRHMRRWAGDDEAETLATEQKEDELMEIRMERKKGWDQSRSQTGVEKKQRKKEDATERRKMAAEAAALKGVVIGVVGQPSVGKTSVLNRVVGKIVGSEARTAGHTKYFQTIPLTHLGEATIVDCPGLLFPAKNQGAVKQKGETKIGGVPRCLQEAFGMFDTAQVQTRGGVSSSGH